MSAFAFTKAQRYLIRRSPERAEEVGEKLGRTIFKLYKKHRQRALDNLQLAFPLMPEAEREALGQRVLEHFGKVTADFLISGRRSQEELDRSMTVEGLENLNEALKLERGVIMITGHFGNWERLSAWVSTHGYKLSVISRDVSNSQLNRMVNELREGPGTTVIPRGDSARAIIERLRRNELIGILPDQNSEEAFIPFFDHPAGTVLGPGVLSERTGAPVVPCWSVWTGPGQYRMIVEPALTPEPGYSRKGEGTMRAIHKSLEAIIRKHPEQWLWFHDRWKSARRRGMI